MSIHPGRILAAAACLMSFALPVAAQEIKIGLDSPPDRQRSGSYVFASTLAEHLRAAGMQVKEMPVNSIGGEAERLDQTTQGLLEVNMADLARAAQLNRIAFGFSAPYLFDSLAHLDRATEQADLLGKLNAGTTPKGARIVALVPVGGGTGIFNTKKPITRPEDMADLRIRALDENQLRLFRAWGTNGVIITMPEVANALQTGIAHGYLNPPFVPFIFGHADILKHYTEANVSQALRVAMVSEDWYRGLKPDQRRVFDEGVRKASAANREWVKTSDQQALEQLRKAGIQITSLTAEGRARFKELSKSVYTAILSQQEIQVFIDAAEKSR
ncbi:MAG: TRAP transporter substrate-binding protein [Alphaproteobacteria bacterium]|nr:TRAP transporter substrate-binding protein [Alphaproteobacteria bacterium]